MALLLHFFLPGFIEAHQERPQRPFQSSTGADRAGEYRLSVERTETNFVTETGRQSLVQRHERTTCPPYWGQGSTAYTT